MRETNLTTMSTAEMAAQLGVCARTLQALAREPNSPVLRVGRVLRWPAAETLAWLRSRQRNHVTSNNEVSFG